MRRSAIVFSALLALSACQQSAPSPMAQTVVVSDEPVDPAFSSRLCPLWDNGASLKEAGFRVAEVADRDQFLKGFNALPPATNATADQVFSVSRADGTKVAIFFVVGGCVTKGAELERATFYQILGDDL